MRLGRLRGLLRREWTRAGAFPSSSTRWTPKCSLCTEPPEPQSAIITPEDVLPTLSNDQGNSTTLEHDDMWDALESVDQPEEDAFSRREEESEPLFPSLVDKTARLFGEEHKSTSDHWRRTKIDHERVINLIGTTPKMPTQALLKICKKYGDAVGLYRRGTIVYVEYRNRFDRKMAIMGLRNQFLMNSVLYAKPADWNWKQSLVQSVEERRHPFMSQEPHIVIYGLPDRTATRDVEDLFGQVGTLERVVRTVSGEFAVFYQSQEDAKRAMQLSGTKLNDTMMKLRLNKLHLPGAPTHVLKIKVLSASPLDYLDFFGQEPGLGCIKLPNHALLIAEKALHIRLHFLSLTAAKESFQRLQFAEFKGYHMCPLYDADAHNYPTPNEVPSFLELRILPRISSSSAGTTPQRIGLGLLADTDAEAKRNRGEVHAILSMAEKYVEVYRKEEDLPTPGAPVQQIRWENAATQTQAALEEFRARLPGTLGRGDRAELPERVQSAQDVPVQDPTKSSSRLTAPTTLAAFAKRRAHPGRAFAQLATESATERRSSAANNNTRKKTQRNKTRRSVGPTTSLENPPEDGFSMRPEMNWKSAEATSSLENPPEDGISMSLDTGQTTDTSTPFEYDAISSYSGRSEELFRIAVGTTPSPTPTYFADEEEDDESLKLRFPVTPEKNP